MVGRLRCVGRGESESVESEIRIGGFWEDDPERRTDGFGLEYWFCSNESNPGQTACFRAAEAVDRARGTRARVAAPVARQPLLLRQRSAALRPGCPAALTR